MDLRHLNAVLDANYQATVKMLSAEHQLSANFLRANSQQTLGIVNEFIERVHSLFARNVQQFSLNSTCAEALVAERTQLRSQAVQAECTCALESAQKLVSITRRSEFYQMTRTMQRQSAGTKSLVLATLGQYNVFGGESQAMVESLRWAAKWLDIMRPSTAATVREERERIVRTTMRADVAMRVCEAAVGVDLALKLEANFRQTWKC